MLPRLEWTVWPLTLVWTQWIAQDEGAWQVSQEWPEEWPEEWAEEWLEEWPVGWEAWVKACHPPEQVPWTIIVQRQCRQTWAHLVRPVWALAGPNRAE